MADTTTRTKIFVSYSRKDIVHLRRLQVHLAHYERLGLIDSWDDTKIVPGARWREEIEKAIEDAKVAIILVSADFLASNFIAENELPPLLAAAQAGGAIILSVILSSCAFEDTNLSEFQTVNNPSRPLLRMKRDEKEETWAKVVRIVKDSIQSKSDEGKVRPPLQGKPPRLTSEQIQEYFSQDVHLQDLLGITSVDAVEFIEIWKQSTKLLCVPIGRDADGKPFILDLKQSAAKGMGPHGIIIGTTGTGKSTLLRSIIMSLAITHDPYTVNFLIMDFTGGGALTDFATLPHTAGLITNLDREPTLINRMKESLLGELRRRQSMLHQEGYLENIEQYQAKRQTNLTLEPMPYLMVIIDGLSELAVEQPSFLEVLATIASNGRSLGMYLLLTTHHINESSSRRLESNLRYRICFRTSSIAESVAALGTPDAYYLPSALSGVGYLNVDTTMYSLFKAAFVPEADALIAGLTGIQSLGSRMYVHSIWLPPLQGRLTLDTIFRRCLPDGMDWSTPLPLGPLRIPLGLLDNPAEQSQVPLMLDFSGTEGHLVIVGASQSGKSTALCTIMTAFMLTHTSQEVQFYCIDMGGGLLHLFEDAPHVGAVCSTTEYDKIRRVVQRMRQILVERESLFIKEGIDRMATYRQLRQKGAFPQEELSDIFLVIDNLKQLQTHLETSNSQLFDDIATIIASGLNYGVHVLLTANQWSEVRPGFRNNIGIRLELRLGDPNESDIDRKQAAIIPLSIPGRGLHPSKLIFQIALPLVNDAAPDAPIQESLRMLVRHIQASGQGLMKAPLILSLPHKVELELIVNLSEKHLIGVPIGLDELHLDPPIPLYIDLITADPHFLILGDRGCGKTTLLRVWIYGIGQRYMPQQVQIVLIDYRKTLRDLRKIPYPLTYAFTLEQIKDVVKYLKDELEQRLEKTLSLTVPHNSQPWSGCHYFLFVDDYEMLASPNPQIPTLLAPLEGLLLSGHEIGFHLVLARRIKGIGQANFDSIFRVISNMECPGLIMNGDPIEGRRVLHNQSASDRLPAGRGYLVQRKHSPLLIQVAYSKPQG